MVMAPIFVIYFSPAESVAIVLLLELAVSVQLIPGAFKDVNWRQIAPLSLASWTCMPLGLWLVLYADQQLIKQLMAATVLTFVFIMARGWRFRGRPNVFISLMVGGLSGMASASTSMGGPPVILYLLSGTQNARTVRATIIIYFVFSVIPVVTGLALAQSIGIDTVWRASILAPAFLATAWISSKFVHYANETLFRRVTFALLTIIALSVLFL